MDSDSDEDKYYAPEDKEDEEEPRPPSERSSFSQPPSPDFSAICVVRNCFADYHTKITYKTFFIRLPCKQLKPRPQCK